MVYVYTVLIQAGGYWHGGQLHAKKWSSQAETRRKNKQNQKHTTQRKEKPPTKKQDQREDQAQDTMQISPKK